MTAHTPQRPPSGAGGQQPVRSSRWQAARAVLSRRLQQFPEPSAAPPPRLGCRGRVVTQSIAAVLILLGCVVTFLGGRPATPPARASTPPAPAPSPTTSPSPGVASADALLAQRSAAFLAAYFTWDARDTDTTYAARWQPYVLPEALPTFIPAEPLTTLDHGTDAAAQSPLPPMAPQHIQQQAGQVQIGVGWTIAVLPEGGEGATWQPREVQAALTLLQGPDGAWYVSALTWSSQIGGTP